MEIDNLALRKRHYPLSGGTLFLLVHPYSIRHSYINLSLISGVPYMGLIRHSYINSSLISGAPYFGGI